MPSPLHTLLLKRAAPRGWLRFDEFMELALYAPGLGYYTRPATRVGRGRGTDFFTSTSLGSLFGELICAAAQTLLGPTAAEHTFVEIGVEPNSDGSPGEGVLRGVAHPFAGAKTIPVGSPFEINGRCIVFSNELFDAQPCRRFHFTQGRWEEWGVFVDGETLREGPVLVPAGELPTLLPASAIEGYRLDLPLASVSLLERVCAGNWQGLFLAADYGKTWAELAGHCPQGTVRAYHQHRQSNDLVANLGTQDLTCHVCWDWLAAGLVKAGFAKPLVESQEAFFVHHAPEFLARTLQAEASRPSARKMALLQLLHPGNMGQKFQILHATR